MLILMKFFLNLKKNMMIILCLASFFHQCLLMVLHKTLSNSKSSQVSRTLLNILVYHNYAVNWMVLIHPPISNSSSPLSKSLKTIPSIPITTDVPQFS